jgi:hypothetical protein
MTAGKAIFLTAYYLYNRFGKIVNIRCYPDESDRSYLDLLIQFVQEERERAFDPEILGALAAGGQPILSNPGCGR